MLTINRETNSFQCPDSTLLYLVFFSCTHFILIYTPSQRFTQVCRTTMEQVFFLLLHKIAKNLKVCDEMPIKRLKQTMYSCDYSIAISGLHFAHCPAKSGSSLLPSWWWWFFLVEVEWTCWFNIKVRSILWSQIIALLLNSTSHNITTASVWK